jgi:lipoate-protein ligase A
MIFIRNDITDPYFNIAAEEYFMRDTKKEYFLLYVNEPSVIIGKHQNAYAEINYGFIKDNNTKVVRRISGGGAVWHDPGNLNFSFIRNGKEGELVNFRRYMQPVLDFLIKLGLKANFKGKNSIEVNGYKISGNAEHVYKKRVLHHGTLLFNTNLDNLKDALNADPQKYLDKSVKSVRTKTANIIDLLNFKIDMREFGNAFYKYIIAGDPGGRITDMEPSDIQKIKLLADNKYSKWDWNFGYSPPYKLNNKTDISGCDLGIFLEVEKAQIIKFIISGNLIEPSLVKKIESAITGQRHEEETIKGILKQDELNAIFDRISPAEMVKLFF